MAVNKKTSIWQNFLTPIKFLLRQPVWDDLKFPATTISIFGFGSDPSFDSANVGYTFANNATETLYMIGQFPHNREPGTLISPHVHWRQTEAGLPRWKLEYKWVDNGAAVPAAFTPIYVYKNIFEYTGGTIMQMSEFPAIEDTEDYGVSSVLIMKFSREGGDELDTFDANALLYEFDIHYQIDTLGSFSEYVKYGV